MPAPQIPGDRADLKGFAVYFVDSVALADDREAEDKSDVIADIVWRHLGVDHVTVLGHGAFGAAGLFGASVLKLTTDEREVGASAAIVGMDLPNVAGVGRSAWLSGLTLYNISAGRELPVGVVVHEAVDWVGLGDARADSELRLMVNAVKNRHEVWPHHLAELSEDEARSRLDDASLDMVNRLGAMGPPFDQIARGVAALRGVGVFMADAHPRNLGWSEAAGEFKIFDLGVSSARAREKVQVLSGPRPRIGRVRWREA